MTIEMSLSVATGILAIWALSATVGLGLAIKKLKANEQRSRRQANTPGDLVDQPRPEELANASAPADGGAEIPPPAHDPELSDSSSKRGPARSEAQELAAAAALRRAAAQTPFLEVEAWSS